MKTLSVGCTIGILGGGQLGRMTAMAAAQLGCHTHIFCSDKTEPAVEVAGTVTLASFDDEVALARFAQTVDVVTLEWENVPLRALEIVLRKAPVFPGSHVLKVAQDRGQEKSFARQNDIGTADFEIVHSEVELEAAMKRFSLPAILKSTRMGYDGKGQVRLDPSIKAKDAWQEMGAEEGIVESFVDFECEISVIVARREDGVMEAFPPVRNEHKNHILARTLWPAVLHPDIEDEAVKLAKRMADKLGVVGLLAVEMFVLKRPNEKGQRVLMNEIAPRPHNSGHWTMDACACSQYEQLVRAICGWPLGDVTPHSQAEMINLLGDDVNMVPRYLAQEGACVHLYGKAEVRSGRKMGHVTLLERLSKK